MPPPLTPQSARATLPANGMTNIRRRIVASSALIAGVGVGDPPGSLPPIESDPLSGREHILLSKLTANCLIPLNLEGNPVKLYRPAISQRP